MKIFDQAEQLLNEIDDRQEHCDYENVLPLIRKFRVFMKDCHVEFFDIYFTGNLGAVEGFVKDLLAPPDEKLWSSYYAGNYLRDHLFRTRYGLALMKQNMPATA